MSLRQNNNNIDIIYPKDSVVIFHDLEHNPEGSIVDKWPLHCTLVAPFHTAEAISLESIAICIRNELVDFRNISATPNASALFGPQEDIPVRLIDSTAENIYGEKYDRKALNLLRTRVLLGLSAIGISVPLSTWGVRGDYTPHISCPESTELQPFSIDELTIGVKLASSEKSIARVVSRD